MASAYASAYIPPPPDDEFLDPLPFSSQQGNSRLAGSNSLPYS